MRDGRLPVAANSAADARPSAESPSAEPPTTDQRLTEKDIVGLKYFDQLLPLFKRLHDDGCQRDKAGNRELHFDQSCLMVLVFLFNSICSSLRALQQASELHNVQKKLGCERAALGSLSEATDRPDHTMRLVIVKIRPHASKGKRCSWDRKSGAAHPASIATAS